MLGTDALQERLRDIKMVVLDVDGVMTAGEIVLGATDEYKAFNALDGHGIRLLARHGVRVAVITGRLSKAVRRRAAELGIEDLFEEAKEKAPCFRALLARHGLTPKEALYIGDDLPDLPVMRMAGVGVAVCDGHEEVVARADYVTAKPGGKGAVREVGDMILKAQGKWQEAMKRYLGE